MDSFYEKVRISYKGWEVSFLLYAYILENRSLLYEVNNKPLFKLIRDCELSEDKFYIDAMGDVARPELISLLNTVAAEDTVIVRSLVDLADTPAAVVSVLKQFGESGVHVVSIKEDYYEYAKDFHMFSDSLSIFDELAEKKRKLGIERAKADGRMGRKPNKEVKHKVWRLKTAEFSVNEIIDLCGISRSTYYRILKEKKIR